MNATQLRSAIYIAALCGLYLSTAMLIPAMVDLYYGHSDWKVFAACAFMVGALSLTAAMATRGPPPVFTKRMGFLLVNVLWATFSVVGAIPMMFSGPQLSFAQALFESVSGITTTGSTVLSGLDHMPPGLLMWRSLLCWLGGIGIVALGLFVLPFLRVGGMSFFKMESSDTGDKPFARLATFTRAFIGVYVGITIACAIAYDFAGMTRFDAINHAFTTIATAGFSTHDASFAYFRSDAILWVSSFFMTVCSLPFSILIVFIVRGRLDALRDPQIVVFLGYLLFFSVSASIYNHLANDVPFHRALTHGVFNFASILSTTGFSSDDYLGWGPFAVTAAFFATFAGGCSGSTAGGIKAYRFVIMFGIIHNGLKRLIYPSAIYSVRYGTQTVDVEVQRTVFLFFTSYIFIWFVGSMALSTFGHDFATSTSAVLTALSNVGPGVSDLIGPSGNFATMNEGSLYILSLMMLLGRLEVLSVLVLLLPTFWRT
ncbi:TrkH family potassium uptake protein [Ciceribacter sp. L1K23]|uniref:TrkH family potassium uptake protein n=1 Tax=Ciceribacter sp. L1K23 TaxID=2820276 RepID=UPI001B81F238|nr:TrkH family potassium uptake protein [Ciceribacter sp. L1K23]MBR0555855.1 TrkH family potassium uptake protein [Ciceribacter sp. L1K23]